MRRYETRMIAATKVRAKTMTVVGAAVNRVNSPATPKSSAAICTDARPIQDAGFEVFLSTDDTDFIDFERKSDIAPGTELASLKASPSVLRTRYAEQNLPSTGRSARSAFRPARSVLGCNQWIIF